MKSFSDLSRVLLSMVAVLCAALAAPPATAEPGPRLPARPASAPEELSDARVIVKYRAGSSLMRALSARPTSAAGMRPLHAATLSQRLSLPLSDGPVLGARTQAMRGAGLSSAQLAERLAALPDVEWAVPDERRTIAALPNDPYFGAGQSAVTPESGQWYLRAPTAALPSAINAVGAWDITTGSPALTVAVLDTGVRLDHPDLAGKLHPGYDFVTDTRYANDGGGRDADPGDPGDWVTAGYCGTGEPATSSTWHGTQVAGLIGAATNNGLGMAGTGWNVKVLPVRVLGRCGGDDSDIIAAMRWAAGLSADPVANPNPARVINMSLGSTGNCPASYRDTIAELNAAGVTVVIAGGNSTGLAVSVPANCPGAIAVAGIRHQGTKVGYSNVGTQMTIAAPAGNCVNDFAPCLYPLLTTTNSGSTAPAANIYSDGGNYSVGTSFAAPLVAGTVALMLSVDPTLTPTTVRQVLQSTARPFPASGAAVGVQACRAPTSVEQLECYCTTSTCGAGMLDASAAVTQVRATPAAAPVAAIIAATLTPVAGTAVILDAGGSVAPPGRTLTSYRWAITAGAPLASFSGPTDAATTTLQTAAAGAVSVQLTVTDSTGASHSTVTTLTVSAAPVTVTAGSPGDGGGGGGGMASVTWLCGLVLAWLMLSWQRRQGARWPGRRQTRRARP
jgi:serine protease